MTIDTQALRERANEARAWTFSSSGDPNDGVKYTIELAQSVIDLCDALEQERGASAHADDRRREETFKLVELREEVERLRVVVRDERSGGYAEGILAGQESGRRHVSEQPCNCDCHFLGDCECDTPNCVNAPYGSKAEGQQ